jgi:hypothetical protein
MSEVELVERRTAKYEKSASGLLAQSKTTLLPLADAVTPVGVEAATAALAVEPAINNPAMTAKSVNRRN